MAQHHKVHTQNCEDEDDDSVKKILRRISGKLDRIVEIESKIDNINEKIQRLMSLSDDLTLEETSHKSDIHELKNRVAILEDRVGISYRSDSDIMS